MPERRFVGLLISDQNYLKHLKEHYDFLCVEIDNYLNGKHHFAKLMAVSLRVVFHKTEQSTSILPGLTDRYGMTLSLRSSFNPLFGKAHFYVGFTIGGLPDLKMPSLHAVSFEEYWNELVYKEDATVYTRKQVILFAANRWGGAHVDPQIPEKYLKLTKDDGPRLVSKKHGEETIITRVVFEMAYQVVNALREGLPILEKKIYEQK